MTYYQLRHFEKRLRHGGGRLISCVFIQRGPRRVSVESVFAISYWMTRCLRADPERIRSVAARRRLLPRRRQAMLGETESAEHPLGLRQN